MTKKKELLSYWDCTHCGYTNNPQKRLCENCKTAKKIWQMTKPTRRKYY